MTSLIEIDSMQTVALHGNLWNSPHNQLKRIIGPFRQATIASGHNCGMVYDSCNVPWDWWLDANGKVVALEAR